MPVNEVLLKLAEGHGPGQTSVAYAPIKDKLVIATCGADGVACLRDNFMLEESTCKVDCPPATVLAVDAKGKLMAVGDEQYVKVWLRNHWVPQAASSAWAAICSARPKWMDR